jgi:hypothetical protein
MSDDDSTDPLADAEPGETVTIEREFELSPWYQRAADDLVGRDRELESRLELVETEDTGEQGNETLHATYRAEVTKVGVDEPLGAPEREPTENRWLRRIGAHLAAATATSALAGAVFWALPPFKLIINGETAVVATDPMLAVTLWAVLSLAVVVLHGMDATEDLPDFQEAET